MLFRLLSFLLPKTFTISEKVGEPNNSKTFGAIKPKGLHGIAKII